MSITQSCIPLSTDQTATSPIAANTELVLDGSINRLRLVVDNLQDTLNDIDTAQNQTVLQHLHQIMQALPAVLIILDKQGQISDYNAAASELFACELKQRRWSEILATEFRYHAQSGDLLTQDQRHFSLTTQALPNAAGQLLLLTEVSQERKRQEQHERRSRLEIIGEMFTRLAHQIASPLSTISLCIDEYTRSSKTKETQGLSERARTAVEHLLSLVHELQMYVVGGRQASEAISLRDVLANFEQQVNTRLQRSAASIKVPDVADIPLLLNQELLISALTNLVDNALQSKPQGLRLHLEIEQQQSFVYIYIADNGPGIAENLQQRIFEPFFSTKQQGTGLGLAIARSFIQACGGNLKLASSDQSGSRFEIKIPVHPSHRA